MKGEFQPKNIFDTKSVSKIVVKIKKIRKNKTALSIQNNWMNLCVCVGNLSKLFSSSKTDFNIQIVSFLLF